MSTSRFSFCNIFGKRDVNESVLLLQHFGRMKPRALVFQRDVLKPHKKLVHISNFNMASAPLEFCAQEKNWICPFQKLNMSIWKIDCFRLPFWGSKWCKRTKQVPKQTFEKKVNVKRKNSGEVNCEVYLLPYPIALQRIRIEIGDRSRHTKDWTEPKRGGGNNVPKKKKKKKKKKKTIRKTIWPCYDSIVVIFNIDYLPLVLVSLSVEVESKCKATELHIIAR